MNIETLLQDLDQYRVLEDPYDEVEAIFKALLTEPLRLYPDDDVMALIHRRYYTVHEIYDIPVNGENICRLCILSEDGNPLLFYAVHGHDEDVKGEIHVIDPNWVAETCKLAAHKLADLRSEALRKTLEENPVAKDARITTLGGRKYMGFLNATVFGSHWHAGRDFTRLLSRPYQPYVRTEAGLEPVSLETMQDCGPQEDEHSRVVVQTGKGAIEVERGQLVFQTHDNADDRHAALTHMSAEGEWRRDGKNAKLRYLEILIYLRQPYQWSFQPLWLTFDTEENFHAFISNSPDSTTVSGVVLAKDHPGIIGVKYWR